MPNNKTTTCSRCQCGNVETMLIDAVSTRGELLGAQQLCAECIQNENENGALRYVCPVCKSARLEVVVECRARLIQTENGGDFDVETDTTTPQDSSHEWGDNSVMFCMQCGEQDIADAFENANREAPAPGGDLCDTCHASGVEIAYTKRGKTVCVECADVERDDEDDSDSKGNANA